MNDSGDKIVYVVYVVRDVLVRDYGLRFDAVAGSNYIWYSGFDSKDGIAHVYLTSGLVEIILPSGGLVSVPYDDPELFGKVGKVLGELRELRSKVK